MNGSTSTKDGSAVNAASTDLTVDDKLDHIMEAVAFQTKLLASALIAFDKKLQEKESKIIKVN